MQKLTKAQEAWLIEQLKEIPLHVIQYNRKSDGIFDHNLECWVADTVKKIINQCTENILDVEEKSIETHAKVFKEAIESFPI